MDDNSIDRLVQLEYLGLTEADLAGLKNPFDRRTSADLSEPHMHVLRLMRDPAYFYFTVRHLIGYELAPYQCVVLEEMWRRRFPMLIGARGFGKSFLLGIFAVLYAVFKQGSKIVICGSGFRQAKTVFNYAEKAWYDGAILRSLFAECSRKGPEHGADRWILRLGDSTIVGLPIGDGTRIRGERANVVLADEFASIPRDIFETVIAGFGVVSLSPIEQAKQKARDRVMRKLGVIEDETERAAKAEAGNKIILSGTAYYQFNHFCDYWKKWVGIIRSKGNPKLLAEVCGGEPDPGMDWRDYSVIRCPYNLIPEGYYDEAQVSRAKGTIHSGIFSMEYAACFTGDSNGFFKRSLVESCVTDKEVIPDAPGAVPVKFKPALKGNSSATHILGVDPASEQDNFAVVVLEVAANHRRVVHCWTTNRQRYNAKVKGGQVEQGTYYGFCARKIRELMRAFPNVEVVALDAQGGGQNGVLESLHDPSGILPGEQPIWSITPNHPLSDGKERDGDDQKGLHIVELCNFSNSQYVADANHGLRKDMEDRVLLFPGYDAVMLAEAMVEDDLKKRTSDTLEDCVAEIEELKDELTTIAHTQTPGTLRDKWDTPEVKVAGSKKGRLRKDRYSALLIANHAARRLHRQIETLEYTPHGGFTTNISFDESREIEMYSSAPDWFTSQTEGNYDYYGWALGDDAV